MLIVSYALWPFYSYIYYQNKDGRDKGLVVVLCY